MAFEGLELDRNRMQIPPPDNTPGLERTPIELDRNPATAPQVLPKDEKRAFFASDNELYPEKPLWRPGRLSKSRNIQHQRKKLWFLLVIILIAIIVIAIAVPLGIRHAQHSHNSNAKTEVPNAPETSTTPTLSTVGAFNGTALTTFNVDINSIPLVHLFYQDYAAQIRGLQKLGTQQEGQSWSGGPHFPAVVTNYVKNATPLASVNYTNPNSNVNTAHLFFIDTANTLQEVISTDNLSTWQTGPLGSAAVKASSSSMALAATYSDKWLGTSNGRSAGLRLYYGSTDNQVHELAFVLGDTSWSPQFQFNNSNGNAGISVSSVTNSTGTASLFMFDVTGHLREWNMNGAMKANKASTVFGNWSENPTTASVQTYPNSSLGYAQGWLGFQQANKQINAIKVDPWGSLMNIGNNVPYYGQPSCAIAGASVWIGADAEFSSSFDIFDQPKGNELSEVENTNFAYNTTNLPV